MRLTYASYEDISSGVTECADFKMEFNAIAAYQLMSGIAKDKIGYPIRELCTNAWDAAGGDFHVSLPTLWSNTFTVRDYGPGLSHEQIIDNYTTFFSSTKRDSNDAVGALGLGSKSPFAYLLSANNGAGAGSFMVKSCHDGIIRHYVMALSPGGMPQVKLMLTENMAPEDRTGVEVSFPVHHDDVWKFEGTARRILWFFKPRPLISPDPEYDDDSILQSADDWALHDKGKVPFAEPHVRMGCVAYPLDFAQLDLTDWPWRNSALVFEAEIGALTIQTSREALGYDDRTKQALRALITNYEQSLAAQLQANLEQQPSYLEACAWLMEQSNQLGAKPVKALLPYLTWRGQTPRMSFKIEEKHMTLAIEGRDKFMGFTATKKHDLTPDFLRNAQFVVERTPRYSGMKLRQLFDEGRLAVGDHLIWIRGAGAKLALVQFGKPPFIQLDDVKLPGMDHPRTKHDKSFTKLQFLDPKTGTTTPAWVDASQPQVYVQKGGRRHYRQLWDGETAAELHRQLLILHEHGAIPDPKLRLVVLQGGPQPGWQTFAAFKKAAIEAVLDPVEVALACGKANATSLDYHLADLLKFPFLEAPADVLALLDRAQQYHANVVNASVSKKTSQLLGLLPDKAKPTPLGEHVDINEAFVALCSKYQLLLSLSGRINSWHSLNNESVRDLAYYLKLEAGAQP